MTNRIGLALLVSCLFAFTVTAQSDPVSFADRMAIANVWNEIAVAAQKKDRTALERVYAEDFVHIHAKGKIDNRKERLDAILLGGPTIDTGGEVAFGFRKYGDTIVAAGTIKTTSDDGKPITYAVTKIYARQKGRIVYVGSHASPVIPE